MMEGIEFLKENHCGALTLNDGRIIKYAVIRYNNTELVFFNQKALEEMKIKTEKGLNNSIIDKIRNIYKKIGNEKELINLGYIDTILFDEIKNIDF